MRVVASDDCSVDVDNGIESQSILLVKAAYLHRMSCAGEINHDSCHAV